MNGVLYDAYGKPVRKGPLRRDLARPTYAGVRSRWRDETVADGLTPERLSSILRELDDATSPEAMRDFLTLAEQIEEGRYPHYESVLGTRKRAVSGIEPMVEAASDSAQDKEIADQVRELLEECSWTSLVEDMLDGLGKGWSAVEILWETSEKEWRPRHFEWRDPRFFAWDWETGEQLLLLDDEHPTGMPLDPFKWIVHKPRRKSGRPWRGGLARVGVWGYLINAYAVTDWARFTEVFGMPIRLGRYDAMTAEEADIQILLTALQNLGTDAAAAIPKTMNVEFLDGARGGEGNEVFERLCDWMNRQVSKAVLGQTMTTEDGSSRAQAEVHDRVRQDLRASDARQVAETIQRDLIIPFVALNRGAQEPYPRVRIPVPDPAARNSFTAAVKDLVPLGLRVPSAAVRSRLGLPEPRDGDEVIGRAPQREGSPAGLARALAAEQTAGGADVLDEIAAAALDDWEQDLDPVLAPVRQALAASDTFEEFQGRLPELLSSMDDRALARRLAGAAFTARGVGDASDG